MAISKAYGSITIVDIGDLGTLSVYPESNQPTSIIYDPNIGDVGLYNPNWRSANLQLTPVIYYGGTQLNATNSSVSVTWQRKVGGGTEIDISATQGEAMNPTTKILTVSENVLNSDNPIITYICTAAYIEPQTGSRLTAKGQISFSLISQPTSIKSCAIVGESVFLYGSDQSVKGAESITLTAKLSNCTVANWQYKNSAGAWTTIAGQTSSVLTVKASNTSYFVGDVATIRLNTNIEGIYDLHSITKIHDGAPGGSVLSVTLSNEDMYVPCDSEYETLPGALNEAKTVVTVYNGNENVTDKSTILSNPSGVQGSYNTSNYTYTVSSLDSLTGTVTFSVTYQEKTVTKIFYLTKLPAGTDGLSPVIYSLELSTITLNKTAETHEYSPATFTASAYKIVGDKKTPYDGRFKIYADNDLVSESPNDETSRSYTPQKGSSVSVYKVELYAAGGSGNPLDTQTVTVISDGAKGDTGAGGISFILGNYSDHIPCTVDGETLSTYTLTIPFGAYQGTKRVRCLASIPSLPAGMSVKSNVSATYTEDGVITIQIGKHANLGGLSPSFDTGTINIQLTAQMGMESNPKVVKVFSWTKNKLAASGDDAVLLRAYAPNGNIIHNGKNNVELSCTLTKGTSNVTPSAYKWHVFDHTTSRYVEITDTNTFGGHTGYTTNVLVVPAASVNSYASYCIEVIYQTQTYKDYIAVQDKTDPLQVEIFSTLGDKITNSVGVGCIYARVYQNGEELDELQNLKVSEAEPLSPIEGDVWAHIDKNGQRVVLKKRENSDWIAFTLSNAMCHYKWTFGDYDGIATDLHNQDIVSEKFLYIQGSYISKKMQFNLEVTKA